MSERRERKPSAAQQGRHAARELAVQGLYQWQMTGKSITTIEAEFRSQVADDDLEDHENWVKVMEIADKALFHELLHNTVRFKTELDREIAPLLDRRLEDLDAVSTPFQLKIIPRSMLRDNFESENNSTPSKSTLK